MRRILATVIVLSPGLLALGLAAPATAAALPTFVSPADGSSVPEGTDQVTLSFPEAGTFSLEVYNGSYSYDWYLTPTVTAGTHSWTIDPLTPAGGYTFEVQDIDTGAYETASFTVTAPPVHVTDITAGPNPFYPVVRDGYKDSVRTSYRLSRRADVTATVRRASDGALIRTVHVGTQSRGRHAFVWNGRAKSGNPVKAGKYRVQIAATDSDGHRASARISVKAVTAVVDRSRTVSRTGDQTTATSHTPSCFVEHYYYLNETDLDCWGGRFALATYRFAVPSSAYDVSFGVRGQQGCCSQGRISKTGERLTQRSYRILVKVTNWRAYDIYAVRVSYRYRVRI